MSKPFEFEAFDNSFQGPPTWTIFRRETLNPEAEFAYHLLERWGMVTGVPDGEDRAGRQRIRMMTPVEMVDRATSTAAIFWEHINRMGWVQEIPSPEEARVAIEERRKDRKANRED